MLRLMFTGPAGLLKVRPARQNGVLLRHMTTTALHTARTAKPVYHKTCVPYKCVPQNLC